MIFLKKGMSEPAVMTMWQPVRCEGWRNTLRSKLDVLLRTVAQAVTTKRDRLAVLEPCGNGKPPPEFHVNAAVEWDVFGGFRNGGQVTVISPPLIQDRIADPSLHRLIAVTEVYARRCRPRL